MGGKDQLQGGAAVALQGGGVGIDLHSLAHRHDAGGGKAPGALDLAYADAAGADGVDLLEIAQRRDADAGQVGGFQDGRAFGSGDVMLSCPARPRRRTEETLPEKVLKELFRAAAEVKVLSGNGDACPGVRYQHQVSPPDFGRR